MKFYLFLALLTFSFSSLVMANFRVMSFNTMCKICDIKKNYGPFKERMDAVIDTINRYNPDLISLQELQSIKHTTELLGGLHGQYKAFYKTHNLLWPATDTVVVVNTEKFDVLASNGVWLGPRSPKFSLGWKKRIPRRFTWVTLREKISGREFIFAGSHFDSGSNRVESAMFADDFFKKQTLPLIFAADSNIIPSETSYNTLTDTMDDAFLESESFNLLSNSSEGKLLDACPEGGEGWPQCRIDHILYSKNSPWKTKSFNVDIYRYYKNEKFASDHRAVFIDLVDQ